MNEHDATELAFKNGYKQGTVDTVRKMQEKFTMHFGTYTPKDEVKISGGVQAAWQIRRRNVGGQR